VGTKDSFRDLKLPGSEVDTSISVEHKNTCSCTSIPQYVLMYRYLFKHRDICCILSLSRPIQTFRQAVPWLRRLVAGLSPRRPGFAPGLVYVGFAVDKVALGQVHDD
jgi:hypothetical protein